MLHSYTEIAKIALQNKAANLGMQLTARFNSFGDVTSFKLFRVLANGRRMFLGERTSLKAMDKLITLCGERK